MVMLPRGIWLDGVRHQQVDLRPLCGADQALLDEGTAVQTPARQATELLTRCVLRLGPLQEVTADTIRALAVGDREALMLHLRHLTFGPRMHSVLICPKSECCEKMDLDLLVAELLAPPYADARPLYEVTIRDNGDALQVRFRLPTGGDQEAVADLARTDPQGAAQLVLRRCIACVVTAGTGDPVDPCPAVVQDALPDVMSELDPQAEILLNLTCPACGHEFSALFDTAAYFFRELADHSRSLYREVHQLALHYHWSESEIMSMTAGKRHRYLELLADALSEVSGP